MTAEIISVGTELLLGNILNTNAQYLSRELAALGITVQRESTIGDNHSRLADFVNEAKQRCDLLVFTGGLGPTADDLTKETVASCYGDTLAFDAEEWDKIVAYFTRTGRTVTPNNRKQAMVPVHGRKVVNRHGTAPGAWFEQDGRCAVLLSLIHISEGGCRHRRRCCHRRGQGRPRSGCCAGRQAAGQGDLRQGPSGQPGRQGLRTAAPLKKREHIITRGGGPARRTPGNGCSKSFQKF